MGSDDTSGTNVLPDVRPDTNNGTVEVVQTNHTTGHVTAADVNGTTPADLSPDKAVTTATEETTVPDTTTPNSTISVTTVSKEIVTSKTTKIVNPPYVITDSRPTSTTTAKGVTELAPQDAGSSATPIVVGVIMGLLVVVIIIVVVVILIKKKKIKVPSNMKKMSVKRKKIVTKMENPQYNMGDGKDYRFSMDTPLHVAGPTVNLTKFNNPYLADTPTPRVLQTESPSNKRSSLPRSIASRRDKRRAPPPPNPFGQYDDDKADLYEKASQGSAEVELETFAVRNENAAVVENEPSYPLLKKAASKDPVIANDKSEQNDAEDNVMSSAPSDSLLPKEGKSEVVAIDMATGEYDKTKNPFFEDN